MRGRIYEPGTSILTQGKSYREYNVDKNEKSADVATADLAKSVTRSCSRILSVVLSVSVQADVIAGHPDLNVIFEQTPEKVSQLKIKIRKQEM